MKKRFNLNLDTIEEERKNAPMNEEKKNLPMKSPVKSPIKTFSPIKQPRISLKE